MLMFFVFSKMASVKFVEDYGFTKWAKWSFCSKTCGNSSIRVRKRNCIGTVCSGKAIETEICNKPECPGSIYIYKLH